MKKIFTVKHFYVAMALLSMGTFVVFVIFLIGLWGRLQGWVVPLVVIAGLHYLFSGIDYLRKFRAEKSREELRKILSLLNSLHETI